MQPIILGYFFPTIMIEISKISFQDHHGPRGGIWSASAWRSHFNSVKEKNIVTLRLHFPQLFLPQVFLLCAIAWRYQRNPAMAWFLSTFCFVMTNKVCTSQVRSYYGVIFNLIIISRCIFMSLGFYIL